MEPDPDVVRADPPRARGFRSSHRGAARRRDCRHLPRAPDDARRHPLIRRDRAGTGIAGRRRGCRAPGLPAAARAIHGVEGSHAPAARRRRRRPRPPSPAASSGGRRVVAGARPRGERAGGRALAPLRRGPVVPAGRGGDRGGRARIGGARGPARPREAHPRGRGSARDRAPHPEPRGAARRRLARHHCGIAGCGDAPHVPGTTGGLRPGSGALPWRLSRARLHARPRAGHRGGQPRRARRRRAGDRQRRRRRRPLPDRAALSGARAAAVRGRVVRGAACTDGAAAGEARHAPAPRRRRRQARAVPAAPRRAQPLARTARRAPAARVSAAGADSACRPLPAGAGAGRPHPGADGDAGGGHPRDARAVRRHARDVPGRDTSCLRRDDRDARRRARRRHDRPPRGLPFRRHERPRAVHPRCGAGRSRREPLLRRHPCRRPAAAGDRHHRRGGRTDRAVWRAGRARGDDAATSPPRLPFAQHGPGVDPGREGADPRRTPRRAARGARRRARSGPLGGSRATPDQRTPDPNDEIVVVGARHTPFSDVYHQLLGAPWWLDLLALSGLFLLLNLLFAFGYLSVGGIVGARPGSLADHFFFSVQTMGTIGYGVMHPFSAAAEVLVTAEVITGVSLVALASGILFAKFSVPRARMQFAAWATISPFDGVPTLMFRLGNERASQVIEATVRVVLVRTERTAEGVVFYRMRDLRLERDRSPALARSWIVMHTIDESSPLHDATPETLARDEVELLLTVVGIDETSAQNLHARHTYGHAQVRWGARHADMLSERPDGRLQLDMREFHRVIPTSPTPGFPYPRETA